jgi:hypothetical protein
MKNRPCAGFSYCARERVNCFTRGQELKAGTCRYATVRRGRDLRRVALAKQKSCDLFLPARDQ